VDDRIAARDERIERGGRLERGSITGDGLEERIDVEERARVRPEHTRCAGNTNDGSVRSFAHDLSCTFAPQGITFESDNTFAAMGPSKSWM